jgi:hypothetical protein
MIERPIQMNEMSLSERDMIQEKDNSVLNKSFFSTDFNFPDLVEKKNFLQIKIEPLELHMKLHSKSIKKIFSLMSENNGELEDNYLDYITCLIGEGDELDKQQLLATNNPQTIQNPLDPSYYELLNKTKIFYIGIPGLNTNKKINKRIILKKNSFEKVSSYLNMSIFDMSDFIEIFILSYQEKDSLGERFLLKARMMGKLNQSLEEINKENEIFSGYKKLNVNIEEAQKCERSKLHLLDYYFDNVWNAVEKENLNDENLSFSKTPLDKNSNEDKNNNIANYDLPNSNNINNSKFKNKNINKNGEVKNEGTCADNFCANMCEIF